jgi:hypothetical protein
MKRLLSSSPRVRTASPGSRRCGSRRHGLAHVFICTHIIGKHDPSSEPADTAYHSDKKVSKKPILDEKDREHVVRMIEENALKLTQQQR